VIDIFITGDFAPRMRVNQMIETGAYSSLFNDVLPLIAQADISITNLESPLLEKGTPIAKSGPNLKSPVKSIEALKFAGVSMVTLANNHIMDYGYEGLASTIKLCEQNDIRHIGAGDNLQKASEIQFFTVKNQRLAFINCCENEWSTTQGNLPGCNPLDEISLFHQIEKARQNAQYVIVLVHGGMETFENPSPRMIKLYRWFIDLGADAVISHHTHCFSGYEIYHDKPIVYSLGNFIFDSARRKTSWNIGAAAVLSLENTSISLKLHPFRQCDEEPGVKLLNQEETDSWLKQAKEQSLLIQNDQWVKEQFDKFVKQKAKLYYTYLEQSSSKLILWAKSKGILPKAIRGKKRLLYLNLLRAESHREVLLSLLSKND